MSTHTRTQAASAGSKACNHHSDLKGEFYRECRDRYLPIRLPVSTSNKSREQETRQHRQVVGRSAALWFDVCESAHQCVEPASSWHAGSPAASPLAAHGWLSHCRSEWGCCFPRWEDGSFPASWASFFFSPPLFFNRAPAMAPRRPALADMLMMWRGTRPDPLLFLLLLCLVLPVLSSCCYCIFIRHMWSSALSVAFLMGRVGVQKKSRLNNHVSLEKLWLNGTQLRNIRSVSTSSVTRALRHLGQGAGCVSWHTDIIRS